MPPGALLTRAVEHRVDEGSVAFVVAPCEHLGGDLDEERIELARVPLGEHVVERVVVKSERRECSKSYDSAISCMSAYSMPLCTIFT